MRREGRNPDYPLTLDLRRAPEAWMEGEPAIANEVASEDAAAQQQQAQK